MARLVTIGDSVSQGFMSGGAARTDLAYSTLIANALNANDYRFPHWPLGGMPLNFEVLLRHLSRYYGDDIWGPFEWGSAAIRITGFLDRLEDHYERGEGDFRRPDSQNQTSYHNLASFGFTVSDAWQVTPALCREVLLTDGIEQPEDDWFGLPDNAFYRSAMRVLNPQGDASYHQREQWSQIRWLSHFADKDDDGVQNLIIWLGANNCLGTVVQLKIEDTCEIDNGVFAGLDHYERTRFNLWGKEHFRQDYSTLLDQVTDILNTKSHFAKQPEWRVYVGTVPPVTVAPLIKGCGRAIQTRDPFDAISTLARYYEYYTYVVLDEHAGHASENALRYEEVLSIDKRIAAFNSIICDLVRAKNAALGGVRFRVVDIAAALVRAAFKRNNGQPTYRFPSGFETEGISANTQYYRVRDGRVRAGGLFSLDGIHPSAIGQGLIAHEFLNEMHADGRPSPNSLNWSNIRRSDSLYSRPLELVEELFQHERLARLLVSRLRSQSDEVDA